MCFYSPSIAQPELERVWGRKRVLLIKADQKYRDKINSDSVHKDFTAILTKSFLEVGSLSLVHKDNSATILNGEKNTKSHKYMALNR